MLNSLLHYIAAKHLAKVFFLAKDLPKVTEHIQSRLLFHLVFVIDMDQLTLLSVDKA